MRLRGRAASLVLFLNLCCWVARIHPSRLLSGPRKPQRKVPKVPYKVLDAPALQDDFYLNLVDWSAANVLAVGLGSSVYLWSAHTSKVTRLVDLGADDCVTSVAWTQRVCVFSDVFFACYPVPHTLRVTTRRSPTFFAQGTHLSVGTNLGGVQFWDAQACKRVRTMSGHTARCGTMAWASRTLATGGRDRSVFLRDVRAAAPYSAKLDAHKQEVCGLKWSPDNQTLASGGNDNKLLLWNAAQSSSPVVKFSQHHAAVKALAWSPHKAGTWRRCQRVPSCPCTCSCSCSCTCSCSCSCSSSLHGAFVALAFAQAYWRREAAPRTGAFGFGTPPPGRRCTGWTPAAKCATLRGAAAWTRCVRRRFTGCPRSEKTAAQRACLCLSRPADCEHARLQPEPNHRVEGLFHAKSCDVDWVSMRRIVAESCAFRCNVRRAPRAAPPPQAHVPRVVLGNEPRRHNHRHGCRRCVPHRAPSTDSTTLCSCSSLAPRTDETLRFWNVFPSSKTSKARPGSSLLFPSGGMELR